MARLYSGQRKTPTNTPPFHDRLPAVCHSDGSVILREEAQALREYADALGRAVAKKLADNGAQELIAAVLAEQAT
ncbi:hypothetical protein A7Q01_01685 [Eikenella sp. NML96-A-049]|nr:hypothetical protein A7P97_07285 [Eikenella sp. NML070372]OAM37321.1 hypothetical protein A7P99_07630 [Eikenella sp. NML120348]OAM41674.1 hypothetical protein A7Q01_01685 [Eikenella sp. NML96-A-049]OAM45355.1 hypothetical protein A7Q03_05480 [Eikenella sp. NML99-0057]VDG99548.1 Uncharacterised protein [Helicobacter pametensis]